MKSRISNDEDPMASTADDILQLDSDIGLGDDGVTSSGQPVVSVHADLEVPAKPQRAVKRITTCTNMETRTIR